MAEPTTLTPDQVSALVASIGGQKPDIVKQNGYVYAVQPDGSAKQVTDIPRAAPDNTAPTTIHVAGRGWLQWNPGANGWGVIQGTEETPEQPKPTIVEGGNGKKYIVNRTPDGATFGTEISGVPGNPTAPVVSTEAQWIPGPNYAQDGQWSLNGNYHPKPEKSQDDIHNESSATVAASQAATARANAETNAIETPAQRQTREIAVADKQAHDQIDNALKLAQQNAGDEKALANLKAELERINASHVGEVQRINDAYKHELDQPQLDKTNAIAERGAATSEKNATTSATQVENQRIQNDQANAATERQRQTTVLQDQAKGATDFVNQGIKLGVAPTMGLIRGMIDPLQIALHLSRQTVQSGVIPPSAMPVPQAPVPAGPQPAPMPAVQPTAPAPAPAPTAPPPNFAAMSINDPARGY